MTAYLPGCPPDSVYCPWPAPAPVLSLALVQVEDVNIPHLCREVRDMGWAVVRVAIVPDDVDAIAAEVRGRGWVCTGGAVDEPPQG